MTSTLTLHYCIPDASVARPMITDRALVSPGYVLLAPYYADNYFAGLGEVRLMDVDGGVAHQWKTAHPVLEAKLEKSGNIMVAMTPPTDLLSFPGGGTTGILEELDWDGNVLWSYEDENMTHDFELLPNGSVAYVRWEKAPESFAAGVRGGFVSKMKGVWTNAIIVVNREKKFVWEWKMYDHVDPREYVLGPYIPKSDWSHVNSIRYTPGNPITHTPAFLISVRHISTVFLIDASSGKVIWKSPSGMFSLQHDATLLENGHVLVFDNGLYRLQERPGFWSRVVEIDPRTSAIVWQYDGGVSGIEKSHFVSSIMGSAQRLENGNTLINESTAGVITEVTSEKKVVWEYFARARYRDGRWPILFRIRKYDSTGTQWGSFIKEPAFCISR